MDVPTEYPDELRERAVRMVAEVRPQYPSQWAAITAVAGMLVPRAARRLLYVVSAGMHDRYLVAIGVRGFARCWCNRVRWPL